MFACVSSVHVSPSLASQVLVQSWHGGTGCGSDHHDLPDDLPALHCAHSFRMERVLPSCDPSWRSLRGHHDDKVSQARDRVASVPWPSSHNETNRTRWAGGQLLCPLMVWLVAGKRQKPFCLAVELFPDLTTHPACPPHTCNSFFPLFVSFNVGLWPLYGLFTPLILFTLFFGFVMAHHFIPTCGSSSR